MPHLLMVANGPEYCGINAAVVEFDPQRLLWLMDRFEDLDKVVGGLWNFQVAGGVEWYSLDDHEAASDLEYDPIADFADIKLGEEQRVECECLIVYRNGVYWQGIVKHTDMRVETTVLTREYLTTALGEMKRSLDELSPQHQDPVSGP